MSGPVFPPLFSGLAVKGEPFDKARTEALLGCDAGLVVHNVTRERLSAAVVFAPEMPLGKAVSAMIACGIGFQNALGALAPPEVAVHLTWDGHILVNGAHAGALRMAADETNVEPNWIVIGLELACASPEGVDPGNDPSQTNLAEEGCVEVDPIRLLEAWIRHTLVWLNRLVEEGARPLHAEWRGLAHGIGESVTIDGLSGTFLGIDEDFGMLLRVGDETRLLPLTSRLEGGRE